MFSLHLVLDTIGHFHILYPYMAIEPREALYTKQPRKFNNTKVETAKPIESPSFSKIKPNHTTVTSRSFGLLHEGAHNGTRTNGRTHSPHPRLSYYSRSSPRPSGRMQSALASGLLFLGSSITSRPLTFVTSN